jgi:hypothetical protein
LQLVAKYPAGECYAFFGNANQYKQLTLTDAVTSQMRHWTVYLNIADRCKTFFFADAASSLPMPVFIASHKVATISNHWTSDIAVKSQTLD